MTDIEVSVIEAASRRVQAGSEIVVRTQTAHDSESVLGGHEKMFGKPEWFGEKRVAWQLKPICWQGWLYGIVWLGVLALPLLCLLATSRVPEALIWLMVAGGYMLWDVRQVLRANQADTAEEDVLYITAEDEASLGTQKYKLQLRR